MLEVSTDTADSSEASGDYLIEETLVGQSQGRVEINSTYSTTPSAPTTCLVMGTWIIFFRKNVRKENDEIELDRSMIRRRVLRPWNIPLLPLFERNVKASPLERTRNTWNVPLKDAFSAKTWKLFFSFRKREKARWVLSAEAAKRNQVDEETYQRRLSFSLIAGREYREGEVLPHSTGNCVECSCGSEGRVECSPRDCVPLRPEIPVAPDIPGPPGADFEVFDLARDRGIDEGF